MNDSINFIRQKTDEILDSKEYADASLHGVRALDKFHKMSELGIRTFAK